MLRNMSEKMPSYIACRGTCRSIFIGNYVAINLRSYAVSEQSTRITVTVYSKSKPVAEAGSPVENANGDSGWDEREVLEGNSPSSTTNNWTDTRSNKSAHRILVQARKEERRSVDAHCSCREARRDLERPFCPLADAFSQGGYQ